MVTVLMEHHDLNQQTPLFVLLCSLRAAGQHDNARSSHFHSYVYTCSHTIGLAKHVSAVGTGAAAVATAQAPAGTPASSHTDLGMAAAAAEGAGRNMHGSSPCPDTLNHKYSADNVTSNADSVSVCESGRIYAVLHCPQGSAGQCSATCCQGKRRQIR